MGNRTISSANAAAAQSETVRLLGLLELDFASGYSRVTTAPWDVSFVYGTEGTLTFKGVGVLGSATSVSEVNGAQASGLRATLSGIDNARIAQALGDQYQGRRARLFLGFCNEAWQLVDTPMLLWRGRMDTMAIERGATATITVALESRLADLLRPRTRLYTNEDQQLEYPGDRGMEFVAKQSDVPIVWPAASFFRR
jgi:hypothetical protein